MTTQTTFRNEANTDEVPLLNEKYALNNSNPAKPTYEELVKFVEDLAIYTNRQCVEYVESIEPLKKAMLSINLSAIKLLEKP